MLLSVLQLYADVCITAVQRGTVIVGIGSDAKFMSLTGFKLAYGQRICRQAFDRRILFGLRVISVNLIALCAGDLAPAKRDFTASGFFGREF